MSQPPQPRNVTVVTNFFEIPRLPTIDYTQYDVAFSPAVPIPRKRQELFQRLQSNVAPGIFNPKVLYDGTSLAFSPRRLQFPGGASGCSWSVSSSGDPNPNPQGKGMIQIRLTQTAGELITPTDVNDLILHGKSTPKTAIAVNLLQLIISQHTNLLHTHTSKGYFPGDRFLELKNMGIKLITGYFHSIRAARGRMLLQIDTSMAAVYLHGEVIDVCMNLLNLRNVRDLALDEHIKTLQKFLKGRRIKTRTTGNRTKTIYGLVPNVGDFKFEKEGVGIISIARHYHEAHGITLRHPRLFGLRLTPKNSAHQNVVPAELCSILPGQIVKGKLPNAAIKDVVRFATAKPHERLQRIRGGAETYQSSEYLIESGMKIDRNPMRIAAKLLPPPPVMFGRERSTRVADGKWNVVGQMLHTPKAFDHWAVINFDADKVMGDMVTQNMRLLATCAQKLGMVTRPPAHIGNGNPYEVDKSLDEIMKACEGVMGSTELRKNIGNFILIVILPEEAAPILHQVKFWGDVRHGVLTQCVRSNKIRKANDQYWNNVVLKLNARLTGLNYHASGAYVIKNLSKEPFMVMGADVGHPGPRVQKPSVTSLVFSLDPHAAKYAATCRIQSPRQEVIQDLEAMVRHALNGFVSMCKRGPARIFFFRDGVSEGEYQKICDEEIKAIDRAVAKLWDEVKAPDPKPKVTFIVVGKRHHAVFFPGSQDSDDSKGNVKAGCVVDEGITRPGYPNFYLQSHAAIQGTSRSSNYVVLQDHNFNNHLPMLQDLAFSLTHVYAKATRSVSIPAPVYYADLVCTKALLHMDPVETARLQSMDTSSVSSGSEPPLDLEAWQRVFKQVNSNMIPKMWFL